MRRSTRMATSAASAVVGALVGALMVLGADAITRTTSPAASGSSRPSPIHERVGDSDWVSSGRVLLAWSPGGLPAITERVLEDMAGVREVTTVVAGMDWLEASRTADGAPLDAPPRDLAIPLEVAIVEPEEYSSFVPAAERDLVLGLDQHEALLARSEAELRGAGAGMRLRLRDRVLTASAVISDVATNGYEALMRGPVPASWTRADRFVLIKLARAKRREGVQARIERLLPSGQVLRVKSQRETPYLRYGDAVQPQLIIKRSFGEFAARPLPDGRVAIDSRWVARNIRRGRVPILGRIACHRAMFPQLREALGELVTDGLAFVIDPDQYAGCFNPRFIDRQPGGRLSHHAWGMALDINYLENGFGTRPDQDGRLVEEMEQWGFTWGGRWLIPDGMHFEWNRWP